MHKISVLDGVYTIVKRYQDSDEVHNHFDDNDWRSIKWLIDKGYYNG